MRTFRISAMLLALIFTALAAGCGNKGDLVKPTPPAGTQQPQTPPAPVDKPAQDSGQH